ncbi:hypothetical protein [Acetivibrio cellulolyticus]|uniref:hypothetical protein n=1 Tax=Acetivibrio cellulolyticus TaxID=35830 RepID=UPI0001E2C69A|nr:hypothetical protein [Acetivibrio cellulolyticus]
MKDINFKDLVSALKRVDGSVVKEMMEHDKGVLRKTVVSISPYTVTLEYIDFGRSQRALKFYATNNNGEEIHFDSVKSLVDTLGVKLQFENN